ncbi:unnamed protein product [Lactuca saligna]|uniref:DUF7054 domain-containing protein n=1 Tax=Lactuca saligna TaxID=75948 RepID=A0AA36DWP5_LACSI|nr:unnamed protein product [Lactuca saligna]
MSQMPLRRRIPVSRRIRPPRPSPSTHRKVAIHRSSNWKKQYSKSINRCNSEPTLLIAGISLADAGVDVGDDHRYMTPPGDSCSIFRTRISTDVFSSSPELLPNSPEKSKSYNKDAKVVVKVMVEGSPGPIRALVKLGSSVDETIRLVMNKYNAEGRSPQIHQDVTSSYELHHSYFSLKRLDKSNVIGEIGSRSFYMRKSVNDKEDMCSNGSVDSIIVESTTNDSPTSRLNIFLRGLVYQELKKIITMTNKIWRFFGCFDG